MTVYLSLTFTCNFYLPHIHWNLYMVVQFKTVSVRRQLKGGPQKCCTQTKICTLYRIKALQALHCAPSLHLHQARAITLSKMKSKGRCISLSLNIINIMHHSTCVNSGYVQCSKGNRSKSRQTRVTVHVFCKSSHSNLHLCEVS